ncbi:MAG: M1 family metallopeptidase [Flavobacteriales bacterium]|nr:M1 family metallopeptidase [Flavobacteriales bacterium]
MKKILFAMASVILIAISCNTNESSNKKEESEVSHSNKKYVKDVHSFAVPDEISVDHISLDLQLFFDAKVISGTASHRLVHNAPADYVFFDIDKINIKAVRADDVDTKFEILEGNEFGQALKVKVGPETEMVHIDYDTDPSSAAVQWLEPEQTGGKEHPFLFTQGQAILTRSWIPCQDSPGIRVTYDAKVSVPGELMAVMSASNPTENNGTGIYTFEMKQAIPPYLIALAVGDLEFRSVGERAGVYAEPGMIDRSAKELEDMEDMIVAAEGLYGEYAWDQYDVIVLPPSFPFGGMENPRLTFATPTIIAGDKSLTSLIAHELAHSWSGNLVTNATWDDFWLNEGFTVYFEYRIMEEVFGKSYTDMLKTLGLQDLKHTIDDLGHDHADTHLKLALEGRNPDDGMTDIAYEKGHMFLEMLENSYGREIFDAFLKGYFEKHKFQNMTTERFLTYLDKELISQHDVEVNVNEWVYGPGLPANSPDIKSDRFAKVDTEMTAWLNGDKSLDEIETSEWSTHEWLHFLRAVPNDLNMERMSSLDSAFELTASTNSEIQGIWYVKAANTGYENAFPAIEEFLVNVGRRKFLTPIYTSLKENGNLELAKDIYSKARPNYHSVSRGTMDELLGWES